MVLAPAVSEWNIDVGKADYFIGKKYDIPYFFETPQKKMMREPGGPDTITFRAWSGTYYQFYIGTYHNRPALYITSTLEDCYIMPKGCLSLEKSAEKYIHSSNRRTPIKGSFSGYYSYGKKILEMREKLMENLQKDGVTFSDEAVGRIFEILSRRVKDERSSGT